MKSNRHPSATFKLNGQSNKHLFESRSSATEHYVLMNLQMTYRFEMLHPGPIGDLDDGKSLRGTYTLNPHFPGSDSISNEIISTLDGYMC